MVREDWESGPGLSAQKKSGDSRARSEAEARARGGKAPLKALLSAPSESLSTAWNPGGHPPVLPTEGRAKTGKTLGWTQDTWCPVSLLRMRTLSLSTH